MGKIRRNNMAVRIQKDLDKEGEGKVVDPDTIDWLTGSYKTKDEVEREKENQGNETNDTEVRLLVLIL